MKTHKVAARIFYQQTVHQFLTNCNIPSLVHNNISDEAQVEQLLNDAYLRTPLYFKNLVKDFKDPSGRDRIPVILNIDGTYIDIEGSSDIELQKYMYYAPRAHHVAKWINITDMAPKFVGFIPIASSQTPSSGDGLLLSTHIQLEDSGSSGLYIRTLLRGSTSFFVILVSDAGFVAEVPNSPIQARGSDTVSLPEVCLQENCILLHTSNKYDTYHLRRNNDGKIIKGPRVPRQPSIDENNVKFTRAIRKAQEQIHGAFKKKFHFFDERHLSNSYLLPFNSKELRSFGLTQDFKNSPTLNFISVVGCSLVNATHPGFYPLYMDSREEVRAANLFLHCLFLENLLHHPEIWPIHLVASRGTSSGWRELTFGSLNDTDPVAFPQLDIELINPVALELVSGPHALYRANSVLTYMKQLLLKVLKLGISLGFDKKYFARKSLSFRNVFAILIRLNQKRLKRLGKLKIVNGISTSLRCGTV